MTTQQTTIRPVEFTRINNDVNGNPRYVCHFLNFTNEADRIQAITDQQKGLNRSHIDALYDLGLLRSRQLGGKKFHNKQYGGGIVFQMYSGEQEEMSRKIREIQNSHK